MSPEVKELVEVKKKKTVGSRIEIPKALRRDLNIIMDDMPRSFTVADACVELIREAVAARLAKKTTLQ